MHWQLAFVEVLPAQLLKLAFLLPLRGMDV
jgi:hypothetical protein